MTAEGVRPEVGTVRVSSTGEVDTPVELERSANSVQALLGHGVVAELNRLPIDGEIGCGRVVMIPPATLDAARALLYEADRYTYGPAAARLRLDRREFQATLARLQYLFTLAGREGNAVWIRI